MMPSPLDALSAPPRVSRGSGKENGSRSAASPEDGMARNLNGANFGGTSPDNAGAGLLF